MYNRCSGGVCLRVWVIGCLVAPHGNKSLSAHRISDTSTPDCFPQRLTSLVKHKKTYAERRTCTDNTHTQCFTYTVCNILIILLDIWNTELVMRRGQIMIINFNSFYCQCQISTLEICDICSGVCHPPSYSSYQELQETSKHEGHFLWRYERHAAVIKASTWKNLSAALNCFLPVGIKR